MGMQAQVNVSNAANEEKLLNPLVAFSSKSSEHLLNLAINVSNFSIHREQEDSYTVEEEKGF